MISTSGQVTQVRNASWNGQVAANGSTEFGFIGTSSGSTAAAPTATCSSP